jgi:hypothetical protein
MFGKAFWVNLFERAVSTFAQAAVGVLSAGSLGLFTVNWLDVVSVAGLAALLSVLKTFSVVAAAPVPPAIVTLAPAPAAAVAADPVVPVPVDAVQPIV